MESYTINHKPNSRVRTSEVTIEQVESLYIGKGNCCRCGCGGKYIYPKTELDVAKINAVLEKMSSGIYEVESIDDKFFEIVIKTHKSGNTLVNAIYLK